MGSTTTTSTSFRRSSRTISDLGPPHPLRQPSDTPDRRQQECRSIVADGRVGGVRPRGLGCDAPDRPLSCEDRYRLARRLAQGGVSALHAAGVAARARPGPSLAGPYAPAEPSRTTKTDTDGGAVGGLCVALRAQAARITQ